LATETNKKAPPKESSSKKPEKKHETTMEFISSMAVVLVVGLFIITFNLQAFEIPSSSMENTLLIGDHVFVDRVTVAPKTNWMPLIPYRTPRHGDIIVFLSPAEPGLYVVKRIMGIPGDHIRLKDGRSEPLDEARLLEDVSAACAGLAAGLAAPDNSLKRKSVSFCIFSIASASFFTWKLFSSVLPRSSRSSF